MRLLIVDDHPGVRALIRELAGPGFTDARECNSGEAAIAISRDFLPDVITMDARMPGLSGLEAVRRLHLAQPAIRIIVVSAYDLPALRTAALAAGAADFIAKDDLHQLRPILARLQAAVGHPASAARRPDSPVSEA